MQIRVQNSRVLLIFLIICLFSFVFGEGSVILMMVMDDVCLKCVLCVVIVVFLCLFELFISGKADEC